MVSQRSRPESVEPKKKKKKKYDVPPMGIEVPTTVPTAPVIVALGPQNIYLPIRRLRPITTTSVPEVSNLEMICNYIDRIECSLNLIEMIAKTPSLEDCLREKSDFMRE